MKWGTAFFKWGTTATFIQLVSILTFLFLILRTGLINVSTHIFRSRVRQIQDLGHPKSKLRIFSKMTHIFKIRFNLDSYEYLASLKMQNYRAPFNKPKNAKLEGALFLVFIIVKKQCDILRYLCMCDTLFFGKVQFVLHDTCFISYQDWYASLENSKWEKIDEMLTDSQDRRKVWKSVRASSNPNLLKQYIFLLYLPKSRWAITPLFSDSDGPAQVGMRC